MTKAKSAKCIFIFLAVLCAIFSLTGLAYNASTLFIDYSDIITEGKTPYFYHAFYTMSGLCIACYVTLFYCSVQFFRKNIHVLKLFIGLMIFEILQYLLIGYFWRMENAEIAHSVAAATGVSGGGLVLQYFIFFPLWSPFAAYWACKNMDESIKDEK